MEASELQTKSAAPEDPGAPGAPGRQPVREPVRPILRSGVVRRRHRSDLVRKRAAAARRRRVLQFLLPWGKRLATLAIMPVAVLMAPVTWDYYVTAPWTRDGSVRVQVAGVAPQISGQITERRVADNQFVHKGDVLYVIDPFDFEVA